MIKIFRNPSLIKPLSIIIALNVIILTSSFTLVPKKVKLFAQKLPEIPDSTLRVVGFFLMMIGLLVVYLGGAKND